MITRGQYFKRNRYNILFALFLIAGCFACVHGYGNDDAASWIVGGFCLIMAGVVDYAGRRAYRKLQETERRTNTNFK